MSKKASVWKCSKCNTYFRPSKIRFSCPNCSSASTSPIFDDVDESEIWNKKEVLSLIRDVVCDKCGKIVPITKCYDFKDEGRFCYDCMTCVECGKKADGNIRHRHEGKSYCPECAKKIIEQKVEQILGKQILETHQGRYYGGHKAHLAGGYFNKEDTGIMRLFEKSFGYYKIVSEK